MDKIKIITDLIYLSQESTETTREYCEKEKIFAKLGVALFQSEIPGVGLAAIQIGYPIRAAIVRFDKLSLNLINPKILEFDNPTAFYNEACLSLPGKTINTKRFNQITVEWTNEKGEKKKAAFTGLEAIVLQHEIDHMEGLLITDRQLEPYIRETRKIGRNEKCPCGSGKKYKKCCGR